MEIKNLARSLTLRRQTKGWTIEANFIAISGQVYAFSTTKQMLKFLNKKLSKI